MSQNGRHVLALAKALFYLFGTDGSEPTPQFTIADGQEFESLEEVIGKPSVEVALNASDFLLALLGKRACQVASHRTSPISEDVIEQQILEVGQYIEQAQRQQRKHVEQLKHRFKPAYRATSYNTHPY